ncbi:hypothetical protein M1D80_09445 [Phyllobacteriaceae bacterium JZ32]
MTTTDTTTPRLDGAYRGRRLSWAEFWKLRPDRRPDNDNDEKQEDVA